MDLPAVNGMNMADRRVTLNSPDTVSGNIRG
jgi:hypothetical protein